MTIIQTLKPLLLPFVPKLAPNEQNDVKRNQQYTTVTGNSVYESDREQDSSKPRVSFWKHGYIHLTGSIVARYTPAVIVPVPTLKDSKHH